MKSCTKLLIPSLFFSVPVFSQPFVTLDARSMAMGDTGVASAQIGTAGIFNPALLSNNDDEYIHVILPNVGVSVFADPDAIDAYNDIEEKYIDELDSAISAMENPSSVEQFTNSKNIFTNSANGLNNSLSDLSEKPFRFNAAALSSVSVATKTLGVSLYASGNASIETSPIITDCDNQLLSDYISFFEGVNNKGDLEDASKNPPTVGCNNIEIVTATGSDDYEITNPTDELTSEVLVAGVTISELGLALAHEFVIFGKDISFGLTPKLQTITSYYARPSVQELDDENYDLGDELEDSEKEDNDFNIDFGVATSFLPNDSLTIGLTLKNLLANSYKTKANTTGNSVSFDVDTQARAGIAWAAPLGITIAADLDLTKNKPYFLGEDTQFFGAGIEWNIINIVRLRGGFRTNLADSDDQVLTAGLGFNIIAVHFDIGAQFGDNNAGAALQLGMAF